MRSEVSGSGAGVVVGGVTTGTSPGPPLPPSPPEGGVVCEEGAGADEIPPPCCGVAELVNGPLCVGALCGSV